MNKTSEIKKIIGNGIKDAGFKYLRLDSGIVWIFSREINGVEEHVLIQQHTKDRNEYKIMLSTTARGNGRFEIGNILTEYADTEYWQAETDVEFIELMGWFAEFIKNYGIAVLDDMLIEKPDSFETPERKQWFKEHKEELLNKYETKYHILESGSSYEKLRRIDEVLFENREANEDKESIERIYDFLLGMASILSNIILEEEGAEIFYDTYRIEIRIPHKSWYWSLEPIHIISQAWIRYHKNNPLGGAKDHVWGMVHGFIHDSVIKMTKDEFVDYIANYITQQNKVNRHDIQMLDQNKKVNADFIVQKNKYRVIIKCIHSNKKIGTKLMNDELNSLSLDPDDRLIVALNQECAEAAHRMIFKLPNKAWLLTCKNLFTIGFEIDRLGNFD